tara:strand:+ start:695 stop:817 length:123 start_codon:yes stop_codon:yes gene_type:complete
VVLVVILLAVAAAEEMKIMDLHHQVHQTADTAAVERAQET